MIGAFLGALASAGGAAMQWSAAHEANTINWMNLQFQKKNAKDQLDLATATRPDVYGNKLSYNQLTDEWEIDTTPEQQAILDAGEREQLLSLTEDAKRNRDLRRRQERRSVEADDVYRDELAEYRYEEPGSAGSFEDEGIADVVRAVQGRTGKGSAATSRAALRLGEGGRLPQILKTAGDEAGMSTGENILRGKELGRQRQREAETGHQSKYLPALERFAGIADRVGQAPQRFSELPSTMGRSLESMLSSIMGAQRSGASQVGGAFSELASGVRDSAPDLSGLAEMLSQIGGEGGDTPQFNAPEVEEFGGGGFGGPAPTLADRTGPDSSVFNTPSFSTSGWMGGPQARKENDGSFSGVLDWLMKMYT